MSEVQFLIEDCIFTYPTPEHQGGLSRPGYSGVGSGLVYQGLVGPAARQALAEVTAVHVPTGITVVINRFNRKRNKELAIDELRTKVNEYINKYEPKEV